LGRIFKIESLVKNWMHLLSRTVVHGFFFILSFHTLHGQMSLLDSLKRLVPGKHADTSQVNALNELARQLQKIGNYDSSELYALRANGMATALGYKPGIARSYFYLGGTDLGKGKFPGALKNYLTALKIFEELNNKRGMAQSYNGMGNLYGQQLNYTEALKNYANSLKFSREISDKTGLASVYNNMGNIYNDLENYGEALASYKASLKISEEAGKLFMVAASYNNIGNLHTKQGEYDEALKMQLAGLKIREALGDRGGVANSLLNTGAVYVYLKNYRAAEQYGLLALDAFREIGEVDGVMSTCYMLSEICEYAGQPKNALKHYKNFVAARDSLINEENTKKMVQTQMQYEFDKKEAAAKLEQEKKDVIAAAESKRQRIILLAISGFGLLLLGFAIFAYRSFLLKKKANVEISKQKNLIEEKQKEILDSIHYAKRIQTALQPSERYVAKTLNRLVAHK